MRSLFQRSSGEPDRRSGENSRSSSVEIEQSPCLGLASSSDESQCSRFVGFLQLILKGAPRCVLPSPNSDIFSDDHLFFVFPLIV